MNFHDEPYFARRSIANTTEWGTDRAGALDLIQDALNLRTPTIHDKEPGTDKLVVKAKATEGAREKQEKIKERFKEWVWQDDERRERLVRKYNDEFNNVRLQTFNGDHLTLPGASQVVTLHPHQKAAVSPSCKHPTRCLDMLLAPARPTRWLRLGWNCGGWGWRRNRCSSCQTTCSASFRRNCSRCIRAPPSLWPGRRISRRASDGN
jgi:hypothetical protein